MDGIDSWSATAGVVLVVAGLGLFVLSVFTHFAFLLHATVAFVIGIVILLTLRKQEHIEPIKKEYKT